VKYICKLCGEEFESDELDGLFMHVVYGHDIAPKLVKYNISMR
jgi:hypothetical protein